MKTLKTFTKDQLIDRCSRIMNIHTYNGNSISDKVVRRQFQAQRIRLMEGVHSAINWRAGILF